MSPALTISAACGFLGVAAGAFGAHALDQILSPRALEIYQTGVLYHLLHAAVMTAISITIPLSTDSQANFSRLLRVGVWLFFIGILLFSGSLYGLAVFDFRLLGMITPIGGVFFLAGWTTLFLAGLRQKL